MKFDAECNETTPATSFDRFHEDVEIITEMTSNSYKKSFWSNSNHRIIKESKTDMELATFKTFKTAQDLRKIMRSDVKKTTKRDFSTTILVTPPDSPLRAAQFQPWRRVLRTIDR